jgi:Tol biopolymer transport system component
LVAGTTNFDSAVWVTDTSGAQPRRIGAGTNEGSDSVAWVGDKVVSSNVRALTVRDADGGNTTQLSSYSSMYRQLSGCGPSHAVFLENDDKHNSHIGRIDLNTGLASPITDGPGDAKPACTADGSIVVFEQCSPDADKCYIVRKPVASAEITRLIPLNASDGAYPRVSPDNSSILFQREADAKDAYRWLGIVPIKGGEPKYIEMPIPTGDAEAVRWSPNGQAVLFSWRQNGVGNIWSVPLAGGRAKQITQFDADYIFDFDVAPDGRLVISRGKRVQDIVLIKNAK